MSGLGDHGHAVYDRDRWIPGRRHAPLSPRCGKPMLRYEAANGPMLEEPWCARPVGHNGRCRSAAALGRKYAADIERIATMRRVEGRRYGRAASASLAEAGQDRRAAA